METRKKILIVDDEPDAIEFVRAILSTIGNFEILTAADGKEGIMKAQKTIPDLIILDVIMPGENGFYVFYDLRKDNLTKYIPIIMLTGVADKMGMRFFKDDMRKYFDCEPVDYIEKPLDPARLISAVESVFNIQEK